MRATTVLATLAGVVTALLLGGDRSARETAGRAALTVGAVAAAVAVGRRLAGLGTEEPDTVTVALPEDPPATAED